jgi:glycosyltransferase involved in cell wall biosynthesis
MTSSGTKARVCLVGGPDIDKRLELMTTLRDAFDFVPVGTDPELEATFAAQGFRYRSFAMPRGASPIGDLRAAVALIRIFRAERPSIVHTFDTKPGVWGRLAAWCSRVPVVIGTLPGLGSLYSSDDVRARAIRGVYEPLQKVASRRSTLTIFQNPDDAAEFVRRGVVDPRAVSIVPGSGVSTFAMAPRGVEVRRRLRDTFGWPDDRIVAIMVSRLLRTKGVLDFGAAAARVSETRSDVIFVLVGPTDADSLDALTPDELERLRGNVQWLGHRDDIRDLLEAADIFVFPSIYREGIPRVVLEAASMGLPIVAADAPGSREIARPSENALLVPPGDREGLATGISELAASDAMRLKLGRCSRRIAVEEFDLALVARLHGTIYARALAGELAVDRTGGAASAQPGSTGSPG